MNSDKSYSENKDGALDQFIQFGNSALGKIFNLFGHDCLFSEPIKAKGTKGMLKEENI